MYPFTFNDIFRKDHLNINALATDVHVQNLIVFVLNLFYFNNYPLLILKSNVCFNEP